MLHTSMPPTLLTATYLIGTPFPPPPPQSLELSTIHLPGTNNDVFFPSLVLQYVI